MSIWKNKPPAPAPPPAPPREVHLSVWGQAALIGDRVTGARLVPEPTGIAIIGSHMAENRLAFTLPPGTPYGWGALLHLEADGYQPLDQRVFLAPDLDVEMLPVSAALLRLVVSGQFFGLETGAGFTVIECSDFALYHKFLDTVDITAVLEQRRDVGYNMVRIFGMGFPGHFVPAEYGERYYTELPAFYALLATYGLYGEFTVFAGARAVIPDRAAQLAHFGRMVEALTPISNALLEAINEADQPSNTLDSLAALPRPAPPLLSSHGSNGSQAIPVQPYWDYASFHTNSAPEWVRKVGHNAWELWAGPTISNENTRSPDNFNSNDQAYDAAAGGALLPAGSCFHSVNGRTSDLWTGVELENARAWVAGAQSVPLSCQEGAYRHRDDLEGMTYLRVYQRGNSDACIVRIRK